MTSETPQAKEIKLKLTALAKSWKIPYNRMFLLFLLERAAARIASDPILDQRLVFKGGYVSLRIYGSRRYTSDLDASVHNLNLEMARERIKAQFLKNYDDETWFVFEAETPIVAQNNYGGWRLLFRGGIGKAPHASKLFKTARVQIDFAAGDSITPKPQRAATSSFAGRDILSWQVYPIEAILSEKIHALIVKSVPTRAKDVYDIGLHLPKADPKKLKESLEATFRCRSTLLPISIATKVMAVTKDHLTIAWRQSVSVDGPGDLDETLSRISKQLLEWGI